MTSSTRIKTSKTKKKTTKSRKLVTLLFKSNIVYYALFNSLIQLVVACACIVHLDLVITRILGSKAYSVLAIRSCYIHIASVNFDVCQCKVGLFSNVQSLLTLFHGSLCMSNCLICMFIVVTSCLYKRVCQ